MPSPSNTSFTSLCIIICKQRELLWIRDHHAGSGSTEDLCIKVRICKYKVQYFKEILAFSDSYVAICKIMFS